MLEVESPPAITNCSPTTHNHTEVSPLHLQDTVYLQPLATFSPYEVGACNGSVRWNLTDGEAWRHDSLCGGVALSADRYGDVEFRGSFYPLDDDGDGDEDSPLSWDWSGFVFGYEDPGHFYIVLGPRNVETLRGISKSEGNKPLIAAATSTHGLLGKNHIFCQTVTQYLTSPYLTSYLY